MADNFTLARPYAKAIFEIAAKHNEYNRWSYVLKVLCWLTENKWVITFIHNPTIPVSQVADFFCAVCVPDFTEEECNLIRILAYRRRLKIVSFIAKLYESLRADAQKTLKVDLISAIPLTDAQKNHFVECLSAYFSRTVRLDYFVDEALMGGYVVKAENRVMDGSLRGGLSNLQNMMSGE
jgi:F-type H+-transporting ATPase subunit delta